MKGEDTKESWCRWSWQAERRRSSKHRNRGGGLRGVYRKFLFLCNQWQWSPIVHMVVENFWSHFEASQLKEDATAYERRKHLRWKVCEGHEKSPESDRPMSMGEDTLEKVWGLWKEPQIRQPHDNGRRHLGEGMRAMIGALVQTAPRQRVKTPWRRCEGHNRSPSSDRPWQRAKTPWRRCMGHDRSPSSEYPEPMWWLDMSGQMDSQ